MSLVPYHHSSRYSTGYASGSDDSDLDRAYAAADSRREYYRDSFRRSFDGSNLPTARGAAFDTSLLHTGLTRSDLSQKDAVAPMAGPYGSVVGGYGSAAGYANTGEGMFAAAVANLGGLFAGYDDIAAAMRQYAMFRDIPYTAIRPITVKIAGQPIHIGRKSMSASAGRDGLLTKQFGASAAAMSHQQQSIEIIKQLAAAGLSTSTEHGAALFSKLFDRISHRIDSQQMQKDFTFRQLLEKAPAFIQKAAGGAGETHEENASSGGIEILPSHPIIDAIENPNEYFTQWSLIWCTVVSMIITGRSFWWIDQNSETDYEGSSGITIWYLPSSWVRPVHTRERAFDSWIVKPINTAAWMPVPREDMVYFNVPNPANPTTMFSGLQSQSYAISTDEEIQKAQYHAMRNIQRPGMILTAGRMELPPGVPGQGPRYTLTPEQRTQLINAIRLAYRGAIHTGEPIILDGMIESAEPYGPAPAELDFLNSSKLTRMRIMQGFGVNPIIAGEIEGANRASAYVAEDHFYNNVVNPEIELISQVMTKYLAPRFAAKGEKLYLWIEKAKPRDEDLTMAKLELCAKYGAVEGNVLRKFADLAPRPELEDLPKQPPPKGGFFGGSNVDFGEQDQGGQGGANERSGGRNGNPSRKPGNRTPAAGSPVGAAQAAGRGPRGNPKPVRPRPGVNEDASAQESQRPGRRRRGGRARGKGKPSKTQTSAASAP